MSQRKFTNKELYRSIFAIEDVTKVISENISGLYNLTKKRKLDDDLSFAEESSIEEIATPVNLTKDEEDAIERGLEKGIQEMYAEWSPVKKGDVIKAKRFSGPAGKKKVEDVSFKILDDLDVILKERLKQSKIQWISNDKFLKVEINLPLNMFIKIDKE